MLTPLESSRMPQSIQQDLGPGPLEQSSFLYPQFPCRAMGAATHPELGILGRGGSGVKLTFQQVTSVVLS